MNKTFSGLVAAPFTPFLSTGALKLSVIAPYADFLSRNGISAAFVCGTTGEGPSLTVAERKAVAAEWIKQKPAALDVIVHVGSCCLEDASALATHAEQIGAAAIGCFPPYFFRPATVENLVIWCQLVAAAAPKTPFYYYHIPSMTGYDLPVADFLRAAGDRIPTLAGVKFTHEDMPDYQACLEVAGGEFDCLFGRDEMLLEGTQSGAKGAVGSTYNYAAPLYHRIIELVRGGNLAEARKLQDQAIEMIRLTANAGVTHLAASKQLMAFLGIDCGPARLPLRTPTAQQVTALKSSLDAIGYADFCCRK